MIYRNCEVNVTKDELWQKRLRIERGELHKWSRRGRSYYGKRWRIRDTVVRATLRLLRLRARGERNALHPAIRSLPFTFDTLPEIFRGFTILHLTDLHADGLPGLADRLYDRLRHLEVDLCVLTGDYRFHVRGSCDAVYPPMARILSAVNARHGIVGILGNHDCAEMVPEFARMGVKMLVNEALEVRHGADSIWLIGLDDPHYYGCDDLPGALHKVPEDAFKILLVHTPEMVADAARHGIHLYLCGHTHGGQICAPFVGPLITHASCRRQYVRGVWRYQHLQGYTSTGAGASGVPVRFLCPPEIGVIELHPRTSLATSQTAGRLQEAGWEMPRKFERQ
jgi:predicted MPP superfamily phosphohydrolase